MGRRFDLSGKTPAQWHHPPFDSNQGPARPKAAKVARQVIAADEIDHGVSAATIGKPRDDAFEIIGTIVDHSGGADAADIRQPRSARRCVDGGAQRMGHLHAGRAHSTRAAVNQGVYPLITMHLMSAILPT